MGNLTIKAKIFIGSIVIVLLAVGLVGALSYRQARKALEKATFRQLMSIRDEKADQVSFYLGQIRNWRKNMAQGQFRRRSEGIPPIPPDFTPYYILKRSVKIKPTGYITKGIENANRRTKKHFSEAFGEDLRRKRGIVEVKVTGLRE